MTIEGRVTDITAETPLWIVLALLAIVMGRMLRRYGRAPWNETWRPKTISWGVVGVIVLLYVYVLKPSLL